VNEHQTTVSPAGPGFVVPCSCGVVLTGTGGPAYASRAVADRTAQWHADGMPDYSWTYRITQGTAGRPDRVTIVGTHVGSVQCVGDHWEAQRADHRTAQIMGSPRHFVGHTREEAVALMVARWGWERHARGRGGRRTRIARARSNAGTA
jgi:hypothetical protein